jgi:hypothetical protein
LCTPCGWSFHIETRDDSRVGADTLPHSGTGGRFTLSGFAARSAAGALIAVALVVWVVTLVMEVWTPHTLLSAEELLTTSQPSDDLLATDTTSETETVEASDLLPSEVEGWYVQGVQPVPGSSGQVIEGTYVPRDEARSLTTPLSVYVQATQSGRGAASDLVVRALDRRYPDRQAEFSIDGITVTSGFSADGGSYFVGWEDKGKVYGVDATFRFRVPEEHARGELKPSADEIAAAIMRHRPGLGGAQ